MGPLDLSPTEDLIGLPGCKGRLVTLTPSHPDTTTENYDFLDTEICVMTTFVGMSLCSSAPFTPYSLLVYLFNSINEYNILYFLQICI